MLAASPGTLLTPEITRDEEILEHLNKQKEKLTMKTKVHLGFCRREGWIYAFMQPCSL